MDFAQRETLVYRILSGCLQVLVANKVYLVKGLSPYCRYLAGKIYQRAYEEAAEDGLYDDDELMDFLLDNNLWTIEEENKLEQIQKDLEELKVKYFQIKFRSNEKSKVKVAIKTCKQELQRLYSKRHFYDYLSRSGYATLVKNKYLVGKSLYFKSNSPVFKSDRSYFQYSGNIISEIISTLQDESLTENQYREIARNEPWRSVWGSRKATVGVFSVPAAELTDEQRTLSIWSSIYDNVHESADCPSDEVINDDDMLDGWFIVQRRKRDQDMNKREGEGLIKNRAISNADEVYIKADTPEDARRIESMNDAGAAAIKRRRMGIVHQKGGTAREIDMPDTQQKLNVAIGQKYKQTIMKR